MPATNWSKSPLRGDGMPAVHPDRHHVGARGAQLVEELGERVPVRGGAVQLHRDALAGDAALDEGSAAARGTTRTPVTIPRAGRRRATHRSPSGRGTRCGPCPAPRSGRWPGPSRRPRRPSRGSRCPVVAITMSGGTSISASVCTPQLIVVGQRHHLDGGGAGHAGPALAQQRAQLVGAAGRGHRHPKPGERCPVGLTHVSSVCSPCFRAINRRLPRHIAARQRREFRLTTRRWPRCEVGGQSTRWACTTVNGRCTRSPSSRSAIVAEPRPDVLHLLQRLGRHLLAPSPAASPSSPLPNPAALARYVVGPRKSMRQPLRGQGVADVGFRHRSHRRDDAVDVAVGEAVQVPTGARAASRGTGRRRRPAGRRRRGSDTARCRRRCRTGRHSRSAWWRRRHRSRAPYRRLPRQRDCGPPRSPPVNRPVRSPSVHATPGRSRCRRGRSRCRALRPMMPPSASSSISRGCA